MPHITRFDGRPCGAGHLRVMVQRRLPGWQLCGRVHMSASGVMANIV